VLVGAFGPAVQVQQEGNGSARASNISIRFSGCLSRSASATLFPVPWGRLFPISIRIGSISPPSSKSWKHTFQQRMWAGGQGLPDLDQSSGNTTAVTVQQVGEGVVADSRPFRELFCPSRHSASLHVGTTLLHCNLEAEEIYVSLTFDLSNSSGSSSSVIAGAVMNC
jgi:hypothetical protein